MLGNFDISAPSAPPANFSEDVRIHIAGGALHIEKLEFFHNPGVVLPPTMTKGEDGSAFIHVWVTRPRVQLISTKCEFARTLRFSIPKSALIGIKRLVLVNHDTVAREILSEPHSLARLLQQPEVESDQVGWPNTLAAAGSGCGE